MPPRRPERVVGLHYFYHPAKNRLVEVVSGRATDPAAYRRAWRLQEALGKTPIASSDSYGFIVNRFFLPWLTEAVRMLEEGVAGTATIDEAAKKAFGIGMGPFELMNVTGVPIALHAATTLGRAFGAMYEAPALLRAQVESGQPWDIAGTPDTGQFKTVGDRLATAACYVAAALVDEGVGTIEDTDIGARVGLRWRRGPFELMNHYGIERARDLVTAFATRWSLPVPAALERQAGTGQPFRFTLVRSEVADGVATLTINRPDAMNALNEDVVAQLEDAFQRRRGQSGGEGNRPCGQRQGVSGRSRHPVLRAPHRSRDDRRDCEVHRARSGALASVRDLSQAGRRPPAWPRARGRRRARAGLPRDRRDPEGVTGVSGNRHRHLSRSRRHAAHAEARRARSGEVAGALRSDDRRRGGAGDRHGRQGSCPTSSWTRPSERSSRPAAQAVRGPKPVPDSHRSIAGFFDRHDVEELLAGQATLPEDARLAKSVKRIGTKAPVALRLAAELIDRAAEVPIEQGIALELSHLREIFATKDAYEGLSSLGRKTPVFVGK